MKEIQNFIEERDELELRDLFAMAAMIGLMGKTLGVEEDWCARMNYKFEKVNFSTVRKYPKFLSSYRNNC